MTPPAASLDDLPPPPPETWQQRATYWRYRTIWEAAARCPDPVAWQLPERLGPIWYHTAAAEQRRQVRRNLARVSGHPPPADLERLVRRAYVSYARYWLDSFRLHRMSNDYVRARSTGDGLEHLDDLRDSGRGGILATAHLGSWDVGAFFAAARDWRLAVVAELLEPRRLFDRFVDLRRRVGLEVIPLVRGGDMIARLESRVREGDIATLLADRDLSKRGPVVDFFGEPCRLPPGTARLAQRTGRPVVAGAFLTTPRGWHAVVRPPIDISGHSIEDGTQLVARELEHLIGRYPDQWHVFVRNWLAEREPDHPAVTAGS